jgi:hypothetical protein
MSIGYRHPHSSSFEDQEFSISENPSQGAYMPLRDCRSFGNKQLPASSLVIHSSDDDSGGDAFNTPAHGVSGWTQKETESFSQPDLCYGYNSILRDRRSFHRGESSVSHGQTLPTAGAQPISATDCSDIQSWSPLHLRNDLPAITLESNVDHNITQGDVSETTRSEYAGSSTFSVLDNMNSPIPFSASENPIDGFAGLYDFEQSIPAAGPWYTDPSARLNDPLHHAEPEFHDEQQEVGPPQFDLSDDASEKGENGEWDILSDEPTE